MGRLDDAAKLKVVELRKNGLSLRKIKAVLELENIKVSAQAIYLYLKEFQCKQVQSEDGTAPLALVGTRGNQGGRREGYSNLHLQQLLRDASLHAGYVASAKQNGPAPDARTQPSGSAENSGGRRPERSEQSKDDKDIQIVSVTSLAQSKQERSAQSTAAGAAGVAVTGVYTRRRVTPSPASSPMLAARKRLLDKALSHRMRIRESYQQMTSILRRDQSNSTGSDVRRVPEALPQRPSYDLTTQATQRLAQMRRSVDGQPGGASVPRRLLQSVRPLHPPPRVGIRLPSPAQTLPASQGSSAGAVVQFQNSEGQVQEAGGGGGSGLQEQVKALGSEVHSLGLAVRMLAEQQSQQTQVQRQILSTLQTLASRLGPCNSTSHQQQQQHTQKTSPPTLSAVTTPSTSYTQGTFTYSQGVYPQCNKAPSGFSQMDTPSLDTVEAFKLPVQSPSCVFPASSSADSLPVTHTQPHAEPYSPTYGRQQSQAQVYSPSCGPMYSQSFTQANRDMDKSSDYQGTGTAGAPQGCAASSQPLGTPVSPLTCASQELNVIKLETL